MKRNIGRLDQFIRIFIGLALLAYVVKDGQLMPGWPLLGLLGVVLVGTAALSYCPLYDVFKVSSRDKSDRMV
ncbi:DUF2892 domain-containing protein [Tardiphaga sp. P9-11]|jgi:hypothetical protein|uniref:YgaP family membrane protein n=1 Tax=Tardiphaga sp. P9-11 TaxID=2024614 RepID=UPI0011F0CE17|nr:DUF2892 domain-containing protein [Tardiphaga sp. P9-11]KAA0073995.1 DUF2892 domain-containing protein [Tardiphaga sp. P9-11]